MKNKKYYLSLVVYIVLFMNFVSAYDITLVTYKGEKVPIESDLFWETKSSPFVKNNGMYVPLDIIECPTLFKETFERIVMLLIYKKESDIVGLIQYLMMLYTNFSELALADILNTLAFLKLDNNLLDQCLWYCPEDKRKTVFSFCCDSLLKKIQLFNVFLRVKIPLNDGFICTLDIPANKARVLPLVCEMHGLFMDANNEDYFSKKLPEIELPQKCVPLFNTVVACQDFFNVFFDAIFSFDERTALNRDDFFQKLLNKPELQINYNISVFCNLLDFFQVSLLLDYILDHFAFNINNIDFKKRKFDEISDNFSSDLQMKYEEKKRQAQEERIAGLVTKLTQKKQL